MKRIISFILASLILSAIPAQLMAAKAKIAPSLSVYTQKPSDAQAHFFNPADYGVKTDGKSDVTEALQEAIFKVKREQNFGILFLPEGTYRISKTIQLPNNIRLIGYGKKRPVIYLAPNTPGFDEEQNYMLWFTGGIAPEGQTPPDANAGTFYSALSNIDFKIDKGNPKAIAMRCHVAQHSFINHSDIYVGDALAGIWDVGNELESVRIFGGDYGIISGRTSPGWPMMMVDTYFDGQKRAAIFAKEVGFTIVTMQVQNTPVAFEMQDGLHDRIHMERCYFENVSEAIVKVSVENNTFSQVNLFNLTCVNSPVIALFKESGRVVANYSKRYGVKQYTYGYVYNSMDSNPEFMNILKLDNESKVERPAKDLPLLPSMESWVSVKEYGAKGDGETDDIEAFEKAIAENEVVYVPTGWYRFTRTLKLKENTKLIGLHPFATQFVLKESESAFSGFGAPVALVETPQGGHNIINGIGIFTGGYNYRAVGCKWQSAEDSYLNDVKFVGGHGTLSKPTKEAAPRNYRYSRTISSPSNPSYARGQDLAWDNQYWSLWITNSGGGTIKDIWSADTYASCGIYISNTSTPGRIYAMSLEHHVRTEMRMQNVSNWKIYALQFEEEGSEGPYCHNMEMAGCKDIEFNNVWMYRVIRAFMPKEIGFRVWDCSNVTIRNMHNYTQVLPVVEFPLYQMNKNIPITSWDFASLTITGNEASKVVDSDKLFSPVKLVDGFELATGATKDSKGNIYFCEQRLKKIYKWDAATNTISMIADYPFKPLALATDTEDRLLVIARYDPQPGYMVNGKQESAVVLPDDNPMYSGWGNGGWDVKVYAMNGIDSFEELPLVKSADAKNISKVLHPSSRWRGDYDEIVSAMPEFSFMAPDKKTIIPQTYDLFRCSALFGVKPSQKERVTVANEMNKTTYLYNVADNGALINGTKLLPFAQYSNVTDSNGNIYIADGVVFICNESGEIKNRINFDERPISISLAGANEEYLFVTTHRSVYKVRVRNYFSQAK